MSKNANDPKVAQHPKKLENYLLLGLPSAGKTTYFTVMAKTLQCLANRGKEMKFRCENDETREFVDACWNAIAAREPDWPDKTITYNMGYEFSLLQRFGALGLKLPWGFGYRQASVCYHDYPGEVFEAAFGKAENKVFEELARQMREQVRLARGVFLLLDADKLFNGGDRNAIATSTVHLFKFIIESNPKVKLAILFNKLELFEGMAAECNFEEMFRDRFPDAYAWLPPKYRFFNVYPIGKLDVNEEGRKVPAREISTHGVIEPVRWMIGFKGRYTE